MKLFYDVPAIQQEVEFEAYPVMEDDGIGSYDFWGAKGFDSRPYLSCERNDIIWDKSKFTDEQNKLIDSFVSDNFEQLDKFFCDKFKIDN